MEITLEQLQKILPNNKNIEDWYSVLLKQLPKYNIDNILRISAFMAQCSHESGEFSRIIENLNYKSESLMRVFRSHFEDSDEADEYAHNPEKIANRVYADRMGNGSEESGDGWKYRGRGLIQVTGKSNYQDLANFINMSLDDVCSYLETFEGALVSACWYWTKHKLNALADEENIEKITKIINGGTLGEEDREEKYNRYKDILES